MTLGDKEILELNQLCGAVVDGTLTDAQHRRLQDLLKGSEAARRFYVRAVGQSASLHDYAAEMHADAPELPVRLRWNRRFTWWWTGIVSAAAAIIIGIFFADRHSELVVTETIGAMRPSDVVARITAAKNAQWLSTPLAPGALLRKSQRIQLATGYAEITFDSGARVVIEGAAQLEVNSAWDASLVHGTLKASVPPEAVGFRISNAAVDVVDLGTEFTMITDGKGAADVLVLKGEVEAAPRAADFIEPILLREKESRRFAESGVSDVSDRDEKFTLFTQPLSLDRFTPTIRYAHWSFDENRRDVAAAVTAGDGLKAEDVQFTLEDVTDPAQARSEGHAGRALRFDGQIYAQARFPGISDGGPHTISFWVKVPKDAQPLDTWMIAWPTTLEKLGHRPVQIGWNRRPAEGALGALRTDFRGGRAIGTTSLRDGKWHHVTVCFAAGGSSDAPVQVKQYIDGRLESNQIVPGTERGPGIAVDASLTDTVWLGYRLSQSKYEGRRFRGEIDELFIADRNLEPNEIVALMRTNRLPVSTALALVTVPQ